MPFEGTGTWHGAFFEEACSPIYRFKQADRPHSFQCFTAPCHQRSCQSLGDRKFGTNLKPTYHPALSPQNLYEAKYFTVISLAFCNKSSLQQKFPLQTVSAIIYATNYHLKPPRMVPSKGSFPKHPASKHFTPLNMRPEQDENDTPDSQTGQKRPSGLELGPRKKA